MKRLRRLVLMGALPAATLALAACGGGGGGENEPVRSLSAVVAAADKTADAGSAHFSMAMRMEGVPVQTGGTPQAFTFSGEGAFDYKANRGRIAFDLGELGGLLGQEAGGTIEMILDGKVFYMKFPLLSRLVGGDKPWIKLDVEELSGQKGVDLGSFQQLQQGDPTQMLAYLRAAGDFEEVGTESVRGVETTHYRGSIDLHKALDEVPEDQREQIDELIEKAGLTELPAEAWIDGDGLLRKMTLGFAKLPGEAQGSMSLEMELYDYGAKVDVSPPPADQVTDLSELFKQFVPTGTTESETE